MLTDSAHNIDHHLGELVKIGKQLTGAPWVVPAEFDITKYGLVIAAGKEVVRLRYDDHAEWDVLKEAIRELADALDRLKKP